MLHLFAGQRSDDGDLLVIQRTDSIFRSLFGDMLLNGSVQIIKTARNSSYLWTRPLQ